MKKLGHIALGIAKEELRDLPIRGIEDVIDVLGREKDWDRGQVRGCNFHSSQSPAFHLSALTALSSTHRRLQIIKKLFLFLFLRFLWC